MHDWHVAAGAVFEDVGQWKRGALYPRSGETIGSRVRRECLAARDGLARLTPRPSARSRCRGRMPRGFSDRIYVESLEQPWHRALPLRGDVPRGRHGVRRRGRHAARARRFSGHHHYRQLPAQCCDWFEEWLQTEWPEPRIVLHLADREEWANATLIGPAAREVMAALAARSRPGGLPFIDDARG